MQPYGQPYGQPAYGSSIPQPYGTTQYQTTTTNYGPPPPTPQYQQTTTTYNAPQPYGSPIPNYYGATQYQTTTTNYAPPLPTPYVQPMQSPYQTTTIQQQQNPYTGGVQTTTTTSYVAVPQTYSRVTYQWASRYDRRMAFVPPYGVDPYTAEQMMYASQLFREADTDYNGVMTFDEFVPFMAYLGYYMHSHEAIRLFQMIDTDRSGAIDEREFISYWIYATTTGGFRFDYNHHRMNRRPMNVRLGGRAPNYGNNKIKLGKLNIRF